MIRRFALLAVILLGGCASHPAAPPELPAQLESAPFALNGRISVEHSGERHSAGLHWMHRAESDELLLLGPLGQTVARIYRDAANATLDSDGRHYQAGNAETLMQEVLGWHLPLNGLHHWVLGMSDPEMPAQIERSENGRIAVLHQDGWEVRYTRYNGTLPMRLQMSREELRVQLLVDEWDWDNDAGQ